MTISLTVETQLPLVKGFTPLTLIDYPGKVAAIAFTWGCNIRCGFCHNPGLVVENTGVSSSAQEFLSFLEARRGKLDGVVVTGGEPCLHPGLLDFLANIKEKGFLVKLDSNGLRPDVLRRALELGLVDYFAMDVKAPLGKYSYACGVAVDSSKIEESISLIKSSRVPHEFRTTVVPGLLSLSDLLEVGELVRGADAYFLQQFRPGVTLDPRFSRLSPYSDSFLEQAAFALKSVAGRVAVRGLSY